MKKVNCGTTLILVFISAFLISTGVNLNKLSIYFDLVIILGFIISIITIITLDVGSDDDSGY